MGKYIGDAIMAFWNSPNAVDGHAAVACAAALEQQALLAALRRRLVARGLPPLRARMGLSCGTVLHGNIGSRRRMEWNVIGDEVIVIFVVVLAAVLLLLSLLQELLCRESARFETSPS